MRYIWDPIKDVLNRRKHRLTLADGIPVLEDPARECWIDSRFDYGEERTISLGRNRNTVLVVVSAETSPIEIDLETNRIISVRKATQHETDWYNFGRT
jgi:uncharacterized DUF497 family protein